MNIFLQIQVHNDTLSNFSQYQSSLYYGQIQLKSLIFYFLDKINESSIQCEILKVYFLIYKIQFISNFQNKSNIALDVKQSNYIKVTMGIRLNVYVLTFLTYASVHMMRMTYSFNKHNIQKKFEVGGLFIGLLDSLIFIALAVGTFFRYSILKDKNHNLLCLKAAIPTCLSFSIVPLVSLFTQKNDNNLNETNIGSYILLILAFGSFGFFQFTFFPALLAVFSNYFNFKSEGSQIGFWSSKSNVGNIIGFFCANFLVYSLHIKWEVTMLLSSIFHIISALLLNWLIKDKFQQRKQISTSQFFKYMSEKWKTLQFKLYILSFSFFKAILYSYELWTPSFLVGLGFAKYSGYVPMIFDFSTLFGSYLMGKLYEQKPFNNQQILQKKGLTFYLKKYKFFISSLMIILAALFYIFSSPNIVVYFSLAFFMGIFLGGVYNSLQNNQILNYTNNQPRQTDMLSTVNIGIGCGLVGIFQFIIGLLIHFQQNNIDPKYQTKFLRNGMIYIVLVVLGLVAMTLSFFRAYFHLNQQKQKVKIKQIY